MRIFSFALRKMHLNIFKISVLCGTIIFPSALNAQTTQTSQTQTQTQTTQNASVLQNSSTLQMPEMPSISTSAGLSMPTISTPTIGGKFYTPSINRSYETENSSSGISEKSSSASQIGSQNITSFSAVSNTNSKNPNPSSATSTSNATRKVSANQSSSSGSSNNLQRISSASRILNSIENGLNGTNLSASDLLSMESNGLFSNIYGILGTNTNDIYSESSETLLNNIISSLEEIKQEQKNLNEKINSPQNADTNTNLNQTSDSQIVTYKQSEQTSPSILRFSINGLNILDTCRTVYFSKKENDGSFLLTGDRKYFADGKIFTETFYFLFKSDGNAGSNLGYDVQPAIIQNPENKNSFVYKLSQKKTIKATKTGNLVSLHFSDSDLRTDLLLDIGEQN